MSLLRYIVEHEHGGDWCVKDTKRNVPVATGLTLEEAEENANTFNEKERKAANEFI